MILCKQVISCLFPAQNPHYSHIRSITMVYRTIGLHNLAPATSFLTHFQQLCPTFFSNYTGGRPWSCFLPFIREASSALYVLPRGYLHAHCLTSFTSLPPSQRYLSDYFQLHLSLSPIFFLHWFIICLIPL